MSTTSSPLSRRPEPLTFGLEMTKATSVQQKLAPLGIDPLWETPAEVSAWIERDLAKWTRVVKTAGIKAD